MEKKNRSFYLVFISVFLLLGNLLAEAQTGRTISGIVVSEVGNEPLIGVNVVQKGTTNGAVTDLDGRFTLTVPDGSVLQITYIGYQEQLLTVKPNIAIYQVTLKEDSQALDEVVVVGYGIQKKKLVTGATVQVKGDDIQKLNTVSALGALQSQTPGVNITQSSGMPGEGFNVTIRGLGTTGSSGPLYIIDGVTGADINNLNPADIESMVKTGCGIIQVRTMSFGEMAAIPEIPLRPGQRSRREIWMIKIRKSGKTALCIST